MYFFERRFEKLLISFDFEIPFLIFCFLFLIYFQNASQKDFSKPKKYIYGKCCQPLKPHKPHKPPQPTPSPSQSTQNTLLFYPTTPDDCPFP
jgi:hypothetical protein